MTPADDPTRTHVPRCGDATLPPANDHQQAAADAGSKSAVGPDSSASTQSYAPDAGTGAVIAGKYTLHERIGRRAWEKSGRLGRASR